MDPVNISTHKKRSWSNAVDSFIHQASTFADIGAAWQRMAGSSARLCAFGGLAIGAPRRQMDPPRGGKGDGDGI